MPPWEPYSIKTVSEKTWRRRCQFRFANGLAQDFTSCNNLGSRKDRTFSGHRSKSFSLCCLFVYKGSIQPLHFRVSRIAFCIRPLPQSFATMPFYSSHKQLRICRDDSGEKQVTREYK